MDSTIRASSSRINSTICRSAKSSSHDSWLTSRSLNRWPMSTITCSCSIRVATNTIWQPTMWHACKASIRRVRGRRCSQIHTSRRTPSLENTWRIRCMAPLTRLSRPIAMPRCAATRDCQRSDSPWDRTAISLFSSMVCRNSTTAMAMVVLPIWRCL